MKLKEIFDQSDTIIEPWPDFEANCFRVGGPCRSAFKSHLTYGASVRPENAVTYSAGNEGQKFCGVFSEDAPLLRSSGVAVVFHTFRWPFFFIAKAVRMRIAIHSYGCRTAGEYPACPTIVNSFSLAQNDAASPCWSEN